jgi:bifunctional DNA-binding transcriptional regulator/antitoxin component of YhaV-PrlF toxin-antitoxin module
MKRGDKRPMGKCFGTAMLGPRGQLVIPVEARKELGVHAGDKFLVFGHFDGQGLMFIKVEAAEQFLSFITGQLDEIMEFVRQSKTTGLGSTGKRNPARQAV